MRFFSTFHNPKAEKYATYYTAILIAICGFVIVLNVTALEVSFIEEGALFVEGFISLVMLTRHEKTKEQFPIHVSKILLIKKL